MGEPRVDSQSAESIADADTIDPALAETAPSVKRPRRASSFWRQVLWFGLDVDPRKLTGSVLPLAAGIAVGGAFAVLFLIGEGWNRFDFVELIALVTGVGIGVVASLDTLTRRPALLLPPIAHALGAVIVGVLALRLAGDLDRARSVLAWSLGLHVAALPLLARLWGTLLWQRRLGGATQRRASLLEAARRGEGDHLLIRVVGIEGGQCSVETLDRKHRQLQVFAKLLSPRPRPGLVYILPRALVINRTLPSDRTQPQRWARHIVRADDSLLLGFKAEVAPAEVAVRMVRLAALLLVSISVALTAVAIALA